MTRTLPAAVCRPTRVRVAEVPADRAAPAVVEAEGGEADSAGPAFRDGTPFRDATRGNPTRGNATVASDRVGSAGTAPSAPLTARSTAVAPAPMYGTSSDRRPMTANTQRTRREPRWLSPGAPSTPDREGPAIAGARPAKKEFKCSSGCSLSPGSPFQDEVPHTAPTQCTGKADTTTCVRQCKALRIHFSRLV